MLLKDKVVVVTGGSGLLGTAFIKEIIAQGGKVVIADFDRLKASKLAKEFSSENIFAIQTDITDSDSIKNLISKSLEKFGYIDALVNTAYPKNKSFGAKFEDITYDSFCENLSMNLGGYFLTSQLFAKYFVEKGRGNIINISSIYGVIPPRFEVYEDTNMTMAAEYAAIKAGLVHLVKYMSKYYKGKNIRFNSISLGGIEDGQPDSFLSAYKKFCLNKGMLNPEDITGTLTFLLCDMSKYINGQNIIVDDGFTL